MGVLVGLVQKFWDPYLSYGITCVLRTPGLILLDWWYLSMGMKSLIPGSLDIIGISGAGISMLVVIVVRKKNKKIESKSKSKYNFCHLGLPSPVS